MTLAGFNKSALSAVPCTSRHANACLRLIGMLLVEKHGDWLMDDKAFLTFEDPAAEESGATIVSMAVGQ